MSLLRRFARALAGSKKAVATVATAVFTAAAPTLRRLGLDIGPHEVLLIVGTMATYVASQGVADHGKERAKIEAASKGL